MEQALRSSLYNQVQILHSKVEHCWDSAYCNLLDLMEGSVTLQNEHTSQSSQCVL